MEFNIQEEDTPSMLSFTGLEEQSNNLDLTTAKRGAKKKVYQRK